MAYPPIEPYETGMLDTGDGNSIYWETCGNPDGVAALIVHGGPGSGCSAGVRKSFDPARHRIACSTSATAAGAAARQRPRGRHEPEHHAAPDRRHGTAARAPRRRQVAAARRVVGRDPVARLRQHDPDRVNGMIMVSCTSTRRLELDWLYRGAGRFFPEAWVRFRDYVGASDFRLPTDTEPPIEDLLMRYCRLMETPISASGSRPRRRG